MVNFRLLQDLTVKCIGHDTRFSLRPDRGLYSGSFVMRIILNNRLLFWFLLAMPAIGVAYGLAKGKLDAMDALHPTGEWSVRFMVTAMAIGPLSYILGSPSWLRWLLVRRRWLGFAAFLYAVAHLVLYVVDMGSLDDILAEFTELGIWTGWAAFLFMAVPGLTSNDKIMRGLASSWKRLQRLAYPAAVFTMLHWALLTWEWVPAAVHFGPLILLNLVRLAMLRTQSGKMELTT